MIEGLLCTESQLVKAKEACYIKKEEGWYFCSKKEDFPKNTKKRDNKRLKINSDWFVRELYL